MSILVPLTFAILLYLSISPFLFGRLFGRVREIERRLDLMKADRAIDALQVRLKRLEARLEPASQAGLPPPDTRVFPVAANRPAAAAGAPARHRTPAPSEPAAALAPQSAPAADRAEAAAPAGARMASVAAELRGGASVTGGAPAGRVRALPVTDAPEADAPPPPSRMRRLAYQLIEHLPREEWEGAIGASWLNKLGVLVLVIGISLFIGYSLTQLGPAGRVAIGLAAGALMLAAGVTFERRARFVIFGGGLIGGGWAATYFTTYAMHGLEAARVVTSPALATILLIAVAAAMIAHSLRYRAQSITGLGYIVAFATLAIAPVSTFALAATVPLAATLVWVAYRFGWAGMAAAGLVTTYGVFAITAEPLAGLTIGQFAREQVILGVYWLMFEAFDGLSERRGGRARVARLLFPLNTTAFLGVSLLRWTTVTPATLYVFLGVAACAYLVSAVARALLARRPPVEAEGTVPDVDARSYRAPVTVAVALTVAGVFLRFPGMHANLALLLVGQMVFLSGLRFGDVYLRWLAGAPFAILLARLVFAHTGATIEVPIGGLELLVWTPMALLVAAVFYLNRALVASRGPIDLERTYRAAASALLVLAIGAELSFEYQGAAWLVLALAFFEVGLRERLREFRAHAYAAGAAGIAVGTVVLFDAFVDGRWWIRPTLFAVVAYAWLARLELPRALTLDAEERRKVWYVASWGGALSVLALLQVVTPANYLSIAWMLFAGALFEIGLRPRFTALRRQAYVAAALAAVAALATSVLVPHGAQWSALGLVMLLMTMAAVRPYGRGADRLEAGEREGLRSAGSWLAVFFGAAWLWHVLPRPWLGLGWLVLAVVLLEIALQLRRGESRAQAYSVAGLATATLFIDTFPAVVNAAHLLGLLGAASVLYGGAFARLLKWPPRGLPAEEHGILLDASSACGTAFIAILGWQLLPSPVVALAWGALGLVLLDAGVSQRLTGLCHQGHILLALMAGRLLLANLTAAGATAGVSHRVLTVLPAIVLLYYVAVWLRRAMAQGRAGGDQRLPSLYLHVGTALAVILLQFEAGSAAAVAGWAVMAAGLLALGLRTGDTDLRAQAYLIALLAFVRAWTGTFDVPGTLAGTSDRVAIGAIVIGSFYLAQLLLMRAPATAAAAGAPPRATLVGRADRHARPVFSLLATLLLATLLFNEMSAGLLTVAWALQGTALLGIGFAARDRVLRRSGLVLLTICTVKAFAYDFRHLETLARIVSFIVLGLLMLATSWVYARYNDRLRRLL